MAMILKKVDESPLPPEAMDYDAPETRCLVNLCRELQLVSGDGRFYLACRTSGRLLNIDHMKAWRRLTVLIEDRIIAAVEDGTPTRASRYRHLGSLEK